MHVEDDSDAVSAASKGVRLAQREMPVGPCIPAWECSYIVGLKQRRPNFWANLMTLSRPLVAEGQDVVQARDPGLVQHLGENTETFSTTIEPP